MKFFNLHSEKGLILGLALERKTLEKIVTFLYIADFFALLALGNTIESLL